MARLKLVGNKRDSFVIVVQNGESTATLTQGQVLAFNLSSTPNPASTAGQFVAAGTNDGLIVANPSTVGVPSNGLIAGVLMNANLAPNQIGEALVFGFSQYTLVTALTRAASSDSWAIGASSASGADLIVDTANNCLKISDATVPNSRYRAFAVLCDPIVSQAGSATATSDTRTAIRSNARVFIAMM